MTAYEKHQLSEISRLETVLIDLAKEYAESRKKGVLSESATNKAIEVAYMEMMVETRSFLRLTKIKTELHEQNKPALSNNINTLNGYSK